ncbi:MAG: hypothetical protein OEZ04_14000 [Nitrospinota bacterium]|nr:hypothetical protein [Nitrospinota bacterium]
MTLVIVASKLDREGNKLAGSILAQADMIVFLGDGVYNEPSLVAAHAGLGLPGGHRAAVDPATEGWPDKCAALEDDVSSRKWRFAGKLIQYPGLVEAVAAHDRIITL